LHGVATLSVRLAPQAWRHAALSVKPPDPDLAQCDQASRQPPVSKLTSL
jgi:hypothetical protein